MLGKGNLYNKDVKGGGGTVKKEEEGIVLEIVGSIAKVKVGRHGECKNCGACPGDNAMVIDAKNPIGAKPGQRVAFEMQETNMLMAAFIVYIMPLFAILLGSIAGEWVAPRLGQDQQICQIGGGVIAFILAVLYIKFFDRFVQKNEKMKPVIIRIL